MRRKILRLQNILQISSPRNSKLFFISIILFVVYYGWLDAVLRLIESGILNQSRYNIHTNSDIFFQMAKQLEYWKT